MIIDPTTLEDVALGDEVLVTQAGVRAKGFARAIVTGHDAKKRHIEVRATHIGDVSRTPLRLTYVARTKRGMGGKGWRVLGRDSSRREKQYGTHHRPYQIETL